MHFKLPLPIEALVLTNLPGIPLAPRWRFSEVLVKWSFSKHMHRTETGRCGHFSMRVHEWMMFSHPVQQNYLIIETSASPLDVIFESWRNKSCVQCISNTVSIPGTTKSKWSIKPISLTRFYKHTIISSGYLFKCVNRPTVHLHFPSKHISVALKIMPVMSRRQGRNVLQYCRRENGRNDYLLPKSSALTDECSSCVFF